MNVAAKKVAFRTEGSAAPPAPSSLYLSSFNRRTGWSVAAAIGDCSKSGGVVPGTKALRDSEVIE